MVMIDKKSSFTKQIFDNKADDWVFLGKNLLVLMKNLSF